MAVSGVSVFQARPKANGLLTGIVALICQNCKPTFASVTYITLLRTSKRPPVNHTEWFRG